MNLAAMAWATLRVLVFAWCWRPDILHLHTPAASAPVRLVPRRLWPRGLRIYYTIHGYLHLWPPRGRKELVAQRVEAWQSHKTHVSLFQSGEDLDEARRLGYGSHLRYLGNGVGDAWFEVAPPAMKAAGELSLVFVGRLVREKGILDLLNALAMVPGVAAHLVGDALPSDRDGVTAEVRQMIAGLGLTDRVHLHGMISQEGVRRVYERSHAAVLPSYREGVPRSVIEAMASSRPVIATDIRGCRELVKDGVNGYLIRAGDPEGLAVAIRRMRDLGPSVFAEMAEASRLRADPDRRETKVFERLIESYSMVDEEYDRNGA